jgi:hypothetical protein
MSRRLLAALAALVAAAAAALYYVRLPTGDGARGQTGGATGQVVTASGLVIVDATPLPATYEKPGLASRRFGAMRVYVSAAPEIPVRGATQGGTLDAVPLLVVLENDSYREVDARRDLGLDGAELFSIEVRNPSSAVVFRVTQSAEDVVWAPAERKTFNLRWPAYSPVPGQYVIALKPYFGDADEVRLRVSLK